MKKIAVAVPVYQTVPIETTIALNEIMSLPQSMHGPDVAVVGMHYSNHPLLSFCREHMVGQCLELGPDYCTHILFLDADMVPPQNCVAELVKADRPIVSGLYYERVPPYRPVYRTHYDPALGAPASKQPSYAPNTREVIEVGMCGFGCVLVNVEVFQAIPKPWFAMEQREGEDFYFAAKCQQAKIPIHVHLGVEAGHVGTVVINRKSATLLSEVTR